MESLFNIHIVTKMNDYFKVLEEIKNENSVVWFRGQENANFQLLPKVLRNMKVVGDQFGRDLRPQNVDFSNRGEAVIYPNFMKMLEEFKKEAVEHLLITPKNDFEWLFIAQHYGLPTPLLDWTTDPLVALFFALPKNIYDNSYDMDDAIEEFRSYGYSDKGAAVFAMNPCEYNNLASDFKTHEPQVFNVVENYDTFKGFLNKCDERPIFPACIEGKTLDMRICRQSGNFTIHGEMVWPIEHPNVVKKIIHKIFIPYNCINDVRKFLITLDITESAIYGIKNPKDIISYKIEGLENKRFSERIEELIRCYDAKYRI